MRQYYPLAATTLWVDHQLWGEWTLPYHLENVWDDAAGRGLQLAVQHNDKQAAEALTTDLKNYQQELTNKVPNVP